MAMKNPSHPGSLVRHDCIEASDMTVGEAAGRLGVTQQALSNITDELAPVTPEMALRFEQQGWGRAEVWITMQSAYDLSFRVRAERGDPEQGLATLDALDRHHGTRR